MISVDGLTVEFGGTRNLFFHDISFVINDKDRIALMGKNGAGKSTLLKILAGIRTPNKGYISVTKDTVIAYLPPTFDDRQYLFCFRRNISSLFSSFRNGEKNRVSQ